MDRLRYIIAISLLLAARSAFGACGATTYVWEPDAGTSAWTTNKNWEPNGFPNASTENAYIQSDWFFPVYPNASYTIGCLEIVSGALTATPTGTRTLTISGDYFRNPNLGSLTTNANLTFIMGGTAAQEFTNVDPINRLTISNATTTTLTEAFTVSTAFTINSGAGTIKVQKGLTLSYTGTALTIPSSATLEVQSGATLTAMGGITVNGVLKVNAGGRVLIGNGTTLQVNSGGVLQLQGTSGNVAKLDADQGGSTFTLNVAGSLNANHFSISRTTAAGLNFTGSGSNTVQALSNGDFHYIASGGYAMTIATANSLPATPTNLGFFNDFGYANAYNFNATSYTGSNFTVSNWSGNGGNSFENSTDGANRVNWGSQASLALQITNRTASGSPASTIAKGSADTLFTTFGFALNGAGTATDITQVKLTLSGNNIASDIASVKLYQDTSANCAYSAGVDTQIGSTQTFVGTPPTTTFSIPASTVSVSSTTQVCIHVLLATNANARTNDTLAVAIVGTTDVTNSQGYSFSSASGPPVTGGTTTVTGSATKKWNGGNGTKGAGQNWNANGGDWSPTNAPASTDDCQIGTAYSYPNMNGNYTCTNLNLPTGGSMGWNSTSNTLTLLGGLTLGSSYTFNAATNGNISFASTTASQSFSSSGAAFAGNFVINNTSGSGLVTVDSSFTVNGNLTLTAGTLQITTGNTLTVLGNISVNGGTLRIDPGGTLNLGDNRTLTVALGATFRIVGSSSQTANFTCNGTTNGCAITINGNILAQYYSMNRLAPSGLTINSGATIDGTYYLQNGAFTYPIGASAALLRLNRQVPGNALSDMTFDSNGSPASSPQSIVTNASAGVLTVSNYSGNLTNCCTTDPVYDVQWASPTTTLKLTLEGSAPASVNVGDTLVTVGRFGFQQTDAGPYSNTDLTSIKLTLKGSQDPSDVTGVRLFYDSGCTGTGGTQKGSSQTFSGSPPTTTFSSLSGVTVEADGSSPPKRCIYVQFDISSGATLGNTVGVSIEANPDVVNSQGYSFNGSFSPPSDAGTAIVNGNTITWTGTGGTNWNTTTSWNLSRVPTSSDNCIINDVANDPIISAAGAICKSLTIGNGTLTVNTGQSLQLYGSLVNTGTITMNGTAQLIVRDDGATTTNQTLESSGSIAGLTFNKTAGGYVYIGNSNLTLSSLTIPGSQNFTFNVRNGDNLTLTTGATVTSGTFLVDGGGTVKVVSGQTFLVNGGTVQVAGTNDGYPQGTSNKGKFTNNGSGTWSFSATSGTLNLVGFIFDYLDTNGLQVGGTTTLSALNGGHFSNLSNSYSSVRALQINTSGSIPATADYVGWNWGADNTPPGLADSYYLAYSSGCASQTISLTNWFGDFFQAVDMPQTPTKVSATNCTINMTAAASPVTLTEFKATPYKGAVVLDWSTGLEILHQGFNVFRSTSPDAGYAQINPSLLRNPMASGTVHGDYQFFDRGVLNGVTYYYKLEDIAANGKRTLHGPVSAEPKASLSDAPAPAQNAIIGNDMLPTPTPTPTPGEDEEGPSGPAVALAPGVTLLARTQRSLRLQFDVPAVEREASETVPYQHVRIPGYSLSAVPHLPELPERTVLVEIPPATAAVFTEVRRTQSEIADVDVVAARLWRKQGASLVPDDMEPDSTFYSTNQWLPAPQVELGEIVQNKGLFFLPVTLRPVAYNPVERKIRPLSRLVVDIGLDGTPQWNVGGSLADSGPWGFEGALKITVGESGFYQVNFDDLYEMGIEGPFAGADVSRLRLFNAQGEIPLQVSSGTGFFGSGDWIRFFTPFIETPWSDKNTLVLVVDLVPGLRLGTVDGTVNEFPSTQASFDRRITVKLPSFGLFHEAYGPEQEHIFWSRIYAPPAQPGHDTVSAAVELPYLAEEGTVRVKVYLKGGAGSKIQNPIHSVRLHVNSTSLAGDRREFQSNDAQVLVFNVDASRLVAGKNDLTLQVLGDKVPGDYDIINLEKIVIDYPGTWVAPEGSVDIAQYQAGSTLTLSRLPEEYVHILDVSRPLSPSLVVGATVNEVEGQGYEVRFGTVGGDPAYGRRFHVVTDSKVRSPLALELNRGSNWTGTQQGADVLYIGPRALLDAIAPLADLRQSQGYRVAEVELESIYMEFGRGMRSPQAVKDFIAHAYRNWRSPAPRFVVFVGDGTYDPKDQLGYGKLDGMPIYLEKGMYVDYASDNWFVALNEDGIEPLLAVGRIPGGTPSKVATYVEKVLAFEAGDRRPVGGNRGRMVLVSDADQAGGEHFEQKVDLLAQTLPGWNPKLKVQTLARNQLGDNPLKQRILNAFRQGASVIHYLGHGSEDRWASGAVFHNFDAAALTNQELPLVVAMNCLNGYYYDPDRNYESLADKLLFNEAGGAIAVWASTSLTSPELQIPFQNALYEIIARQPNVTLGEAVRLAKVAGGASAGTAEVVGSWTLLGDPMVSLALPSAAPESLPEGIDSGSTEAPVVAASGSSSGGGGCLSVHGQGKPETGSLFSLFILLGALLLGRRVSRSRV